MRSIRTAVEIQKGSRAIQFHTACATMRRTGFIGLDFYNFGSVPTFGRIGR